MTFEFKDIPLDFKGEVREALAAWVGSLSREEAEAPVIHLLGASYTPSDIRREVDRETEFGKQYLESLFELHERMKQRSKNGSVIDLIRRSVMTRSNFAAS